MMSNLKRVSFKDLPLHAGDPYKSAWGLWDDGQQQEELGTLNLLTPERVLRGIQEAKLGLTIPLNLPLDFPRVPMNPARKPLTHNILAKGRANDDEIFINTQSSTHIDGLRHLGYLDASLLETENDKRFYNGACQSDISGTTRNAKIGVQGLATKGIAGRGVLLDYRSWASKRGITYDPFKTWPITLQDLLAIAREENVSFLPGDILLIRSGWTSHFHSLTAEEQAGLGGREAREFVGVEQSEAMLQWHWDNQFSLVAGDTNAYEAWPPKQAGGQGGWCCHEVFLGGWGLPIGELWDLEALSVACEKYQRWTFFVTVQPLNLPAGVASPANAMAIM